MVFVFHLGNSEAASVSCRLNETWHTDFLLYLIVAHKCLIAFTYKQTVCHAHAIASEILVQYELVECHCLHQHSACRVRQMNKFEIALQYSVLSRGTVYGYIGIIKLHEFAVFHKREVVTVYWCESTVVQFHVPVVTLHVYDINIVTLFVKERIESLCRAQRHIVL